MAPSEPSPPAPSPSPNPAGLCGLDNALYASAWLGIAALLILGSLLVPDPSGTGTHTQLHLPPCAFLMVFGKPCPSCGMTTAFALALHGRPLDALVVQPAGVAVLAACFATWLYLPIAWRSRRPFEHLFEHKAFVPMVVSLIVLIMAVWAWRLLAG